jgi:hypothetical protein
MKKIILTISMVAMFFACDDRLEDLNTPRKNAAVVPFETLFASGTRSLFDMMVSSDVNDNNFRLYAQYWAQTTYPDESQYNMVGRQLPDNVWQNGYRDVLKDLDESKKILNETWEARLMSEEDRQTQEAMIESLEVYTWSVMADMWGALPYTEALDINNLNPKYDMASDVYNSIIDTLNDAITKLGSGGMGFSEEQDLVYQGDVEKWLKFANSLKVRLAVTISDVDAPKATTMINEALASGVFESNEDNATIAYLSESPNTNPLWLDLVASGRADYVVANTIVDKMLELDDPRLTVFADPMEDGSYVGGEYGTSNTYSQNSHVGAIFHEPALEGVILDYVEINFLLAEAAAKGLAITGLSAEEYYEQGIRASFEYWGFDEATADAYLAQPEVAYATAAGDWKQKIGIQEWIAYFNRGVEGWNVWRRLDFEGFNVPDGLDESDIPRRLIFPIKEATLNQGSLDDAIQMIGGSDDVQTRVFWDVF